ncbi:uncharacterized protein LOC127263695 [Andrographis paniculata]|uniref:uncharacterized protein LOC127263695 n=1 Tax=Andrographis paniculata TaxID=175694 RepID=UPI0021E850EC|nr:uncharacterized protein LOC127263695 [Andrographis paniculata]
MALHRKKSQATKCNRFLISITVFGSAGPIRFIVSEEELVAAVIQTALKSYAREERLPVLGTNLNNFMLYCPGPETEALSPWDTIGSFGVRNFMLCKKPDAGNATKENKLPAISRKSSGSWKSWFHKSTSPKISSH